MGVKKFALCAKGVWGSLEPIAKADYKNSTLANWLPQGFLLLFGPKK